MALTQEQVEEITELLGDLGPVKDDMNPKSKAFVDDQIKRFEQYGAKMFVSPKQMKWLKDLHAEFIGTGDEPENTRNGDMDDEILW